jgi:hypothetical protein
MDRITMKKKESLGYFDTKPTHNDWVRLGSFSKLQVWVDDSMDEMIWVEVIDTSVVHGRSPQRVKRVLEVQLTKTEFGAYHVDMTRLDHRYAGRGIAAKAYRYIIKKLDITLQAGCCQSKGGRKVWFDLAQRSDLDVFAKTRYGMARQVGIDCEQREVWIDKKDIYDGDKEMYVFATAA